MTEEKLAEVFAASLHELNLPIALIDGVAFRDHCVLRAPGARRSVGRAAERGNRRRGGRDTAASLTH